MHRPDRSIGWRAGGLATSVFAVTLCVLLGVAAHLWPQFDPFSTLAPFAALLAAPLLILVLRTKDALLRRAEVAALTIAIAAGLLVTGRELVSAFDPAPEAAAARPGRDFRVVTLNVSDRNQNASAIIGFLKREDPDVIVLQEAREALVNRLRASLAAYPTFATCGEEPYCGVVVIAKAEATLLDGGMWVGAPAPAAGLQTQPLRYAAAMVQWTDDGKTRQIPLLAVHVYRNGFVGPAEYQLAALAEKVNAAPGSSAAILAGDFNTASWSVALRDFDHSVAVQRLTHLILTWPARLNVGGPVSTPTILAIDQIYAGADWGVVQIERGPDVGSDHLPIIATLRWQGA